VSVASSPEPNNPHQRHVRRPVPDVVVVGTFPILREHYASLLDNAASRRDVESSEVPAVQGRLGGGVSSLVSWGCRLLEFTDAGR